MRFERSGHDQTEPTSVYVMASGGRVKIGIAASVVARRDMLQLSSPVTIEIAHERRFPTRTAARLVERALHVQFADTRLHGEWFELSAAEAIQAVAAAPEIAEPVKITGRLRTAAAPLPERQPEPPRAAPKPRRQDDEDGPTWDEYQAMDDETWCDFLRPCAETLNFGGPVDYERIDQLEADLRVKYPQYFATRA